MPSHASGPRAARSRWPTAASTCSTSATSAICRPRPPRADRLVVAVNDDASASALKGPGRPVIPAVGSGRAGRGASRRRLRRPLQRADGRTAAPAHSARTCTARAPTTRSTPCPSAPSVSRLRRPHRHRRRRQRAFHPRTRRTAHAWLTRAGQPIKRVLIVKLGALGDIVHAIPVAAALRRAYPSVHIDWLVSAKHREILDLVPVIDRRLVISDRGSAE